MLYIYLLRGRYCNNVRLFSKIIKNTFLYFANISLAHKKLPKWLRNICKIKKCVFNNFGK